MLQLHYFPANASMIPHILLEELGVPFELKLVDRTVNAHQTPAYLKLNPNGLIPVLVDGDLVLYEAAAICLHLADTHAASGLMPVPRPAGAHAAADRAISRAHAGAGGGAAGDWHRESGAALRVTCGDVPLCAVASGSFERASLRAH